MKVPDNIVQQINEVKRELRVRQYVYKKWIKEGKMDEQTARFQINLMNDVLHTLEELKKETLPY